MRKDKKYIIWESGSQSDQRYVDRLFLKIIKKKIAKEQIYTLINKSINL